MRLKYNDVNIQLVDELVNVIGFEYVLVAIRPYYQYVNKVRSQTIEGYNYDIVLMNKGYEKISVKIEGDMKLGYLEEETLSKGVPITFNSLEYKVYAKSSNDFVSYNLSLSAKDIIEKNVHENKIKKEN